VTLYWKLSHIVQRLIPQRWMRAWAMDHVQSLRLKIVEPALDLTIVAHKEVSITVAGEQLRLRPGDTVNVEVAPPVQQVPANELSIPPTFTVH
jgi:hypothetical protein